MSNAGIRFCVGPDRGGPQGLPDRPAVHAALTRWRHQRREEGPAAA